MRRVFHRIKASSQILCSDVHNTKSHVPAGISCKLCALYTDSAENKTLLCVCESIKKPDWLWSSECFLSYENINRHILYTLLLEIPGNEFSQPRLMIRAHFAFIQLSAWCAKVFKDASYREIYTREIFMTQSRVEGVCSCERASARKPQKGEYIIKILCSNVKYATHAPKDFHVNRERASIGEFFFSLTHLMNVLLFCYSVPRTKSTCTEMYHFPFYLNNAISIKFKDCF